jgi:Zn-dependent peptidase ImmA (M78 family)
MDRLDHYAAVVPVRIEDAIRDLGITLSKNAELTPGVSGYIRRVAHNQFEIASTRADHYFRQRFTMAHELGHYILHRSLIGNGTNDDTKYRSTDTSEYYNTAIDDIHEKQANAFAATILIPERKLRDYLDEHTGVSLKQLATAFQVSPSAMRWRLKNLGLYELRFKDQ